MKAKIPVILDTDIGGDIDDTWALAMLLKSPELDLKLVRSRPRLGCCCGRQESRIISPLGDGGSVLMVCGRDKELPTSGVGRVKGAAGLCADAKLAWLAVVTFDFPPAIILSVEQST